jgi:hypothetical protein
MLKIVTAPAHDFVVLTFIASMRNGGLGII